MLENYRDLITSHDIKIGNPNADVIIIEYFDPNCFHCKELNATMHKAMRKLAGKALFVFKPNPIWSHSLAQIQALLIASEEGLFFEMLDKQFALQQPRTGLNLQQIKAIAKEIGMDDALLEERMNNADYAEYILDQYKIRRSNKITSAPTILINGRTVHPQSRTVDCLEKFISAAQSSGS